MKRIRVTVPDNTAWSPTPREMTYDADDFLIKPDGLLLLSNGSQNVAAFPPGHWTRLYVLPENEDTHHA